MSTADDSHRDDPAQGPPPEGGAGPDLPRDYDAAFRAIVDSYGERPVLDDPLDADAPDRPASPSAPEAPLDATLFDTSHLQQEPAAVEPAWHEEEHFVPPEPPPVPRATPARRLAWLGLFLPPVVMLAAVAFGWVLEDWMSMLLVSAFVGGFVFLVATMPRDGRGDGDDGAVV
jgi:hypothetical protein